MSRRPAIVMPIPLQEPNRTMVLVQRSMPHLQNPHRLTPEIEETLQRVESLNAACYASMEDLINRLDTLAQDLSDNSATVKESFDEEDSSVHHIQIVRDKITTFPK